MSNPLKKPPLRLGVNIDHVATVRNARGGTHPDLVRAALLAQQAGADGITAHLREDRRHIIDEDIFRLKESLQLPLNLEMAATEEMQAIALKVKPHAVCIVPEKREEVTTEGGLDVKGQAAFLEVFIVPLKAAGIRVSLFIDPDVSQIDASKKVGAQVVELHTGRYCEVTGAAQHTECRQLADAASYAHQKGLEVHAGHGLTYENVQAIAAMPEIVELNIGHFLMGEAMFTGLEAAIVKMRHLMNEAR